MPARPANLIRRERLLDFLHEHIDRKLIFIAAPPGYGKTALLVDFAHDADLTVCWYSLDATDRDLRTFVEGLLASLRRRYPDFGEETQSVLEASAPLGGDVLSIAGTLVNEMVAAIPEWFVLILDNFHHVEDASEVTEFLSTLLAYQPEHCHLIIASRTVPGTLPFISLAARGEVEGLGPSDLSFTPKEIRRVLEQDPSLRLSPEEVERLIVESEGWIAGILLARHALHRRGDLWARARASGRPLYEYLASEVLESQEPDLQAFLLASSTLEEMTPLLCERALGLEGAEDRLRQLERRNLFVERISEKEDHFRYHALFREFLQARLKEKDPQAFRHLHRLAATWFEQAGAPSHAAQHYMIIEEPLEAARVMDGTAESLLQAGRLKTLVEWAGRLPEDALRTYPRLALFAAKAALRVGKLEQTRRWLSIAEGTFRLRGAEEMVGMALTAQALVALNRGAYTEGIQQAEAALHVLPEERPTSEAAVEALRVQGMCLIRMGRFEEAEEKFRRALEGCRGLEDPHRMVLIQAGLAACLHSQGRVEEAVEVLKVVVAASRELGSPGYLAEALNDLAYNLYLLGDYAGALETLQEALATARRVGHRHVEGFVLVSLGEVLRDLGDLASAKDHLEQGITIAGAGVSTFLLAYGLDALALTHLRSGDLDQALERAREALKQVNREEAPVLSNRYRATLGLIQVQNGQVEEGRANLEEACAFLERTEARQEAARAWLYLAYALHRAGEEAAAVDALRKAAAAYSEVRGRHRLLVDGQPVWSFIEEAALDLDEPVLRQALEAAPRFYAAAQEALRTWAAQTAPPPPSLRAYGFGQSRVERDGVPIPASRWATSTARHLFFYLLSHPPRTRDQIGSDLWPDLRASRLPGTFHNTKYRMQQALGVNPVVYREGRYVIRDDLDIWYDVWEFERLLERARRSPMPKRARYLRQAIALYQGDFLEDCYADWCGARRETLRQQYLQAVGEVAAWWISRSRFDDAIDVLRRGLAVDNLREDFHRRLMEAYARKGQTDEALAQYRRCVETLKRELSVEPSPETVELFHAIREGRFPPRGQ
ncbi:MAG TPA: tetratricopeptide repeat protein [Thermoflexia bacterium]|nr:tetratricopeptide repeat protein [Thermoflexia bacterium]